MHSVLQYAYEIDVAFGEEIILAKMPTTFEHNFISDNSPDFLYGAIPLAVVRKLDTELVPVLFHILVRCLLIVNDFGV